MSSQLSLSIRTSTPVASVNFFVLAIHWSSSPLTNGDQRRSRNAAPASGLKAGAAAWAKAGPPPHAGVRPAPATAAAPIRTSRREQVIWFPPTVLVSLPDAASGSSLQPPAGLGVEQVGVGGIGRDVDGLAGVGQEAVPEHA